MRTKRIKVGLCNLLILVLFIVPVYAEEQPYELPDNEETDEIMTIVLPVEDAVLFALENSTSLKILDNKIDLAGIQKSEAYSNIADMEDAKDTLKSANKLLNSKESELDTGQEQLDAALSALEVGIAPVDIPLESDGNPIVDASGNQLVILQGANIHDNLFAILSSDDMSGTVLQQMIGAVTQDVYDSMTEEQRAGLKVQVIEGIIEQMTAVIEAALMEEFEVSQTTISESSIAIDEARETITLKWLEFDSAMEDASGEIQSKINYNSTITLDVDDASDLMLTMADVNLDVTRYAKKIYTNQIAMLVYKNYYDALYAQKILELKERAMERGKIQFDLTKLSYENGMKSKDDYLLSKMYYTGTVINHRLAEADYKNAMYELKKNMNINMMSEIVLIDSMMSEVSEFELEDGLNSGLTKRLEVQQILGKLEICKLNEEILLDMYKYKSSDYRLEEAKLLVEGAEIELSETKRMVESEIYQSYELVEATGTMMSEAQDLVTDAQEVVDIAELKYEQGYGLENALMKELNLETSAGTIVELIAANEKLTEIEAQVAYIRYNYTMSVIKYQNDAGILTY